VLKIEAKHFYTHNFQSVGVGEEVWAHRSEAYRLVEEAMFSPHPRSPRYSSPAPSESFDLQLLRLQDRSWIYSDSRNDGPDSFYRFWAAG
jgi:hypothetical protein